MITDLRAPADPQASVSAPSPYARRAKWLVAILLVLVFSPLWHIHIFNRRIPPTYSDLVQCWAGARSRARKSSPPNTATTLLARTTKALPDKDSFIPLSRACRTAVSPDRTSALGNRASRVPLHRLGNAASKCLGVSGVFHPAITRTQTTISTLLAVINWPIVWGARFKQPTVLIAALIFLAFVAMASRIAAGIGQLRRKQT